MNWKTTKGKLVQNFEFKSQTELAQFVLKVAKIADEMNHHPDCKIYKAFQLELTLFSHDQGKLTALDHQLAEKIDTIH